MIHPGLIIFTRIPSFPSSRARDRVKPRIPLLVALSIVTCTDLPRFSPYRLGETVG